MDDFSKTRFTITRLIIYTGVLHALLLVYDIANPTAFFNADRAADRMRAITGFLTALKSENGLLDFLGAHGVVGDYLPQAIMYGIAGQFGIIAAQIVLLLFSVRCLFDLALRLGMPPLLALGCTALYIHLPHTLVFPHQLASEAVFVPIFVIAVAKFANALTRSGNALQFAVAGLILGIATLVRPITLLWPVVAVGIVALFAWRKISTHSLASFVVCAFVPLTIWAMIVHSATGVWSLGPSGHDTAHNLYQRVHRMIDTMPPADKQNAKTIYTPAGADPDGTLSVGAYLRFSAEYPGTYFTHLAKDAVVFFGKTGLNKLLLDYLQMFPQAKRDLQNSRESWRIKWEKDGPLATLAYLWDKYSSLLLVSVIASGACVIIVCLAALGTVRVLAEIQAKKLEPVTACLAAMTMAIPIYVFGVSQVVNAMQSRHRAPAEFAMILLAGLAIQYFAQRRTNRHDAASS